MTHNMLSGLALIFVLGTASQILAWRFQFPSILALLLIGLLVGPTGLGALDPDEIFGPILFPLISLSVAIILFEGGLSLRFSELPGVRRVIFSLISLGMLTTWLIAAAGAYYLLNLDFSLAVLFGAILTVSGPTVVIPLLRHIRLKAPVGEVLKWEGILIDPVGAVAAVLVFEALLADRFQLATAMILNGVVHTILVGGAIGVASGVSLAFILRKHLIPEHLQNSLAVMTVIGGYVLSDQFHEESGLVTVTIAGIVLANARGVDLRKMIEFKENLTVLMVSSLFIILAARITPEHISQLNPIRSVLFLALLFFVARPIAVGISTINSTLNWRQRLVIAWMAPRGIVAAAVASVFALQLEKAGFQGAETLVPYTFLVIVGSVVLYGLTSGPLARLVGVAQLTTQGVLFMGTNEVSRAIASILKSEGYPVYLVDTNPRNTTLARIDGLPAKQGNILSEQLLEKIDLQGIGRLFAMTANHEANTLATVKFAQMFGSREVYQLAEISQSERADKQAVASTLQGRLLFGASIDYYELEDRIQAGARVKATSITEEFTFEDFEAFYTDYIPLMLLRSDGSLLVATTDQKLKPDVGDKFIFLGQDNSYRSHIPMQ